MSFCLSPFSHCFFQITTKFEKENTVNNTENSKPYITEHFVLKNQPSKTSPFKPLLQAVNLPEFEVGFIISKILNENNCHYF